MDQIIGAIIFLLIIIAQIIKSIREGVAQPKQPAANKEKGKESLTIARPKQNKQSKPDKRRLADQQPLQSKRSVFNNAKTEPSRQKALVKRLAPQGEEKRFNADPGTLDTGHIVSPTIDPTVKPELGSFTGIYEQGGTFTEFSEPAASLDIVECLAKPEGIIQAVILAEVLNRPAWLETSQQKI